MPGMKIRKVMSVLAFATVLAGAAMAGSKDAEVQAAIKKAALEESVLMSCQKMEPHDLDTIQMKWMLDRQRLMLPILNQLDVSAELFTKFLATTSLDNLTAKTSGPATDLAAFCDGNAEVLKQVIAPDYENLTAALEKLAK
jgi:hypothetical protein